MQVSFAAMHLSTSYDKRDLSRQVSFAATHLHTCLDVRVVASGI